jgi:hypothetical protein
LTAPFALIKNEIRRKVENAVKYLKIVRNNRRKKYLPPRVAKIRRQVVTAGHKV